MEYIFEVCMHIAYCYLYNIYKFPLACTCCVVVFTSIKFNDNCNVFMPVSKERYNQECKILLTGNLFSTYY